MKKEIQVFLKHCISDDQNKNGMYVRSHRKIINDFLFGIQIRKIIMMSNNIYEKHKDLL